MSNYQKTRKSGTVITSAGVTARQAPLERILRGNGTPIVFSIDYDIKGTYALIDARDLQPSHLGSSQNPFHFIPEAQPRNRSTSASGALTPERIANNLRPEEVMYGSTAYTGAPVVNQRGEVIQGNGRAYAIKLYYSQFPDDPKGYRKAIEAGNYLFGFLFLPGFEQALQAIGIYQPVLVRMVDVPDRMAIELGQFTQGDTEAVATNVTKIKSKARLLTKPVLRRIINELIRTSDSDDTSLAELIRNSKVLNVLIKEEVIRVDDLENYTRNGTINEAGVTFVSSLLLNALFRNADVNTSDILTQLPVAVQTAVGKSTLYLLACQGVKSLNNEVAGGVLAYREFQKSGIGSLRAWSNQLDISGKTPADRYPETERAIANLFAVSTTQKEIVAKFRQYAGLVNDRPADMFQPARPGLSKREAIREVFHAEFRPSAELLTKARGAHKRIMGARGGVSKRRIDPDKAFDGKPEAKKRVDHRDTEAIQATVRRVKALVKLRAGQENVAKRSGADRSRRTAAKPVMLPDVNIPSKATPLQRQYDKIKATYPGAILLFRVGDYFETFNEDAVIVSKILAIPLQSGQDKGEGSLDRSAGFPYQLLEASLPKLVKAGYRVAITDQLSDPKLKAIVQRGVTAVVEAESAVKEPKMKASSIVGKSTSKASKKPAIAKSKSTLTNQITPMETETKKGSTDRAAKGRSAKTTIKKAKEGQKATATKKAAAAREKKSAATSMDNVAKGRAAKSTISKAQAAQKNTSTMQAATARKNKGTVKVKSAAEQTNTNFVRELGALSDKIHKKSATGQVREVPVYGISRSEADKKAYQALKRTRKAKNVTNVRLKVS